jgi:hypothetical protein
MAGKTLKKRGRTQLVLLGTVTAALAAGWVGLVVLVVVIVAIVRALCWVLADGDRSQRLALLLTAWRRV